MHMRLCTVIAVDDFQKIIGFRMNLTLFHQFVMVGFDRNFGALKSLDARITGQTKFDLRLKI